MSKSRLSADPSVGVSDLQNVFREWFDEQNSQDMARLLKAPYSMGWKSAPTAEWLGDQPMSSLFKKLFSLYTNGVLASKKVKAALLKQQTAGGRVNFTKKHDSDFVDAMDEQLRIAAAQYREIKKDPSKYSRCVRKASAEEKQMLDSVLSCLHLENQDQAETEIEELAVSDCPTAASSSVFKKVLGKTTSAPESPEPNHLVLAEAATRGSSGRAQASYSRPDLRRQLAFLELDKVEEEEMLRWMQTGVELKERSRKITKKPSAKKGKKTKQPEEAKKQEKQQKKQPSFVQKVLKSSFRKRKCDAAYHSAKKKALNAGASLPEACKAAAAASVKVAVRIDKGELTED
eukprot:Skav236424  [mRNA]  locus=scaffold4432:3940:4977:- [translate_table: standard]